MSKVRKCIREALIDKSDTRRQIQKILNKFNEDVNKSIEKLDNEIIDLEKALLKLEK